MQFIVSKKEFIPPVIAPDIIETLGDAGVQKCAIQRVL